MSGPAPGFLLPLTTPASWVYGRAIAARNRRFDDGSRVGRLDVPVISVGNITTGGVGKTPFVAWLAGLLRGHGRRPVIAMRGYGARSGERNDEHAELADLLPEVDVVADPDRLGALRAHLSSHAEVDCVLLDDGFQHRRLHRDLDLVLVDATRSTLTDHLLPRGNLREPPESLRRADAVIVTRSDAPDAALADAIRRIHGRAAIAWTRHAWTHVRRFDETGVEQRVECGWLRGRRVLAMFGVGNPDAVAAQLERCGASIVHRVAARDHERFTARKLARARTLADDAEAVVMTGKDWVKARHLIDLAAWPVPVIVPCLAIEVTEGARSAHRSRPPDRALS